MGFSAPHFVGRNAGYPVWRSGMTKPLGTHLTSPLPTVARTEATTSNVSGQGRSFCIFSIHTTTSAIVRQNYSNFNIKLLEYGILAASPNHQEKLPSLLLLLYFSNTVNWVSFLDFLEMFRFPNIIISVFNFVKTF